MINGTIRIGSRESVLAVIQSELIIEEIKRVCPGVSAQLVTMKTTGDMILDKSLAVSYTHLTLPTNREV